MTMPDARVEELVVQEVEGETLVYDLRSHRAYCLNAASSLIWHHCDGQMDAREAAASLQRELGLPADEEVVWLGVRGLSKAPEKENVAECNEVPPAAASNSSTPSQ